MLGLLPGCRLHGLFFLADRLCFRLGSGLFGFFLFGFGDLPQLIFAVHILPDLQACAIFLAHAHNIQALARKVAADLHTAVVGGLYDPQLAGAVHALPLVQPGAIDHAALYQIQHLAGKAVLNAVYALAFFDKLPLLPGLVRVFPHLDRRAVFGAVIGHFQHFSACGNDIIKFIFFYHGLCSSFHSLLLPRLLNLFSLLPTIYYYKSFKIPVNSFDGFSYNLSES